jgi:hypothetical protein
VGDDSWRNLPAFQATLPEQAAWRAPQAAQLVASERFRRAATKLIVEHCDHIPAS